MIQEYRLWMTFSNVCHISLPERTRPVDFASEISTKQLKMSNSLLHFLLKTAILNFYLQPGLRIQLECCRYVPFARITCRFVPSVLPPLFRCHTESCAKGK